ncbi:MAG: hypothetical protein FWE90_10440 [Defluviitaleaceae bacterium]|nr:hypothetical protein [Defluviitaleaceae bacterium]
MFTKGIYDTTLTSAAADKLFANITDSNTPDKSFLATLRALLHKRLPQHESVRLTCSAIHRSGQEVFCATNSERMGWFLIDVAHNPLSSSEHTLHIVYTTQSDAGDKMLETVKANAGTGKRYLSSFTRRDDLHVFYARKAKTLFYTNYEGKNTVIFTDKLELKHFHVLQMMIAKYLPSLFADTPLTGPETVLLKSTGNKAAVEYETLIEGFTKDLDIRKELIRIKLTDFETVFERKRADEIREEIEHWRGVYETHLTSLRDVNNKINENQYMLAGLESVINDRSKDSALMEYFMCNKNLSIVSVTGTTISFITHGYADVYDEDAFEIYVAKHGGYMYANLHHTVSKLQMEKLYRAIFSEGRYKLRMCAAYKADIRSGLWAVPHFTFPNESRTYIPNPHIQRNGCVGSYAGFFQEYMRKGDYVGAIEQASVSGRNLNFHDSTVMAHFAETLSHSTISCIEAPGGVLLTPKEAIKRLERGAVCPDL